MKKHIGSGKKILCGVVGTMTLWGTLGTENAAAKWAFLEKIGGKHKTEKSTSATPKADNAPAQHEDAYVVAARGEEPQWMKAPQIPMEMTFAGEKIDLRRYDLRERIDREIMAFCFMHSTTIGTLKRANMYFPILEKILQDENIPTDLKYLALIESNFNTRALSGAGAAGFWQLMKGTARDLNLEVGDEVDERYDIEKSTRAASEYFRRAYKKFGNWPTVAAAYNAGSARIERLLKEQEVDNATDLYLNEETSRYFFRILAAKLIFEQPQAYGFHISREDFYHYPAVREENVSEPVEKWAGWAKERGITYADLRYFNPWIRGVGLHPKDGKTYVVKVVSPADKDFRAEEVSLYAPEWAEE